MHEPLVVGVDGIIGKSLFQFLSKSPRFRKVRGTSRRPENVTKSIDYLDLSDFTQLQGDRPLDSVILCAAISTFRECIAEPSRARAVNVNAAINIAEQVKTRGGYLLFLSTSSVFNGSQFLADERSAAQPLTRYGELKREAEARLLEISDGQFGVLRLTKVVDPHWSLAKGWLNSLEAGQVIHPASDLPCAPLHLTTVTNAIITLVTERAGGIWHLSPPDEITYGEMARTMAQRWGKDLDLVQPKTLADLSVNLEHVPQYAALNAAKFETTFGVNIFPSNTLVTELADQVMSFKSPRHSPASDLTTQTK